MAKTTKEIILNKWKSRMSVDYSIGKSLKQIDKGAKTAIQSSEAKLKKARERYKLGQKFKGSSTVSIKNPEGFLYKAEQKHKKNVKRITDIRKRIYNKRRMSTNSL